MENNLKVGDKVLVSNLEKVLGEGALLRFKFGMCHIKFEEYGPYDLAKERGYFICRIDLAIKARKREIEWV